MPHGGCRAGSATGLALVVGLLAGCVGPPSAAADERAGPGTDAGSAMVERLIGDAACSADSDCRSVAIGAKACGGPDAYRAWSSRQTDVAALHDAVARHAAARRAEQAKSEGTASNCAIVADPGARCDRVAAADAAVAGRCMLRRPAAVGPAAD